VSSDFSSIPERGGGPFSGAIFPPYQRSNAMNRTQALSYMRKHQPDSPWSLEQPTKAQVRSHLQGLAARGAPPDVLSMQARMVAQAMQNGKTLPPHWAALLAPRGVSKV
jgi:hypothetical protein